MLDLYFHLLLPALSFLWDAYRFHDQERLHELAFGSSIPFLSDQSHSLYFPLSFLPLHLCLLVCFPFL